MKFVELNEIEYTEFWNNHPLKTFLSAKEIGDLRQKSGWKVYFVGVKEKNIIIGAAMLISHIRKMSKCDFYSPRGFLLDFKNVDLLNFFIDNVKEYVKAKNGYVLRIDPYIINKQRDIDGNEVKNGINNISITNYLEKKGFKKVKSINTEQAVWMFSLDIENKSEEEILKNMKSNTRNIIKNTEEKGISVRELMYDELDKFQDVLIKTSQRKQFSIRNISYYKNMYQLFHDKGEVKFFVTELNISEYLKILEQEKLEKHNKLMNLSDALANNGKKEALKENLISIENKILDLKSIANKEKKNIIILSSSMFILIKPEIIYLSSGNYEEYMHFNSQYLQQWEMIKYGIKNHFKKYNFYGIPANINNHPKDYGVYKFKKGFNGYVEELIGEFELPITWHYQLFNLIRKFKKSNHHF
ncbi:MAG: peptidoglycan bridge formation glycyltransferase FemA/FemB family protein [Bacilli bacterium]